MQNIECTRFRKVKAVLLTALLTLLLSMGVLLAQAPQKSYADAPDVYTAKMKFKDYGTITLELDRKAAPITVDNFVTLAKKGFYNGLTIHRIPFSGSLIQGGDPEGNGTGGSGTTIKGEFADNGYQNPISHTRGVISMARATKPDSASSQFFILNVDAKGYDGQYAAFGHVTDGLDVLDKLCKTPVQSDLETPVNKPIIESVEIIEGSVPVEWKMGGTWKKTGNRWWYSYDSTTTSKLGKSYPRNEILEIDGKSYGFDSSGWMKTGWFQLAGKWYYSDSSGAMKKNWVKSGGAWYYLDPDNYIMLSSTKRNIDNVTYFFNASGAMRTGWVQDGSNWYYYTSSGTIKTGWLKSGSAWYFLDKKTGIMAANEKRDIDKQTYFFKPDGAMHTGWVQYGDDYYYCASSGEAKSGWVKSGNSWYYLDPSDRIMVSKAKKKIDGKTYFFADSGAMRTGWISEGNDWYLCGSSGAALTGWQKVGAKWYYLDPAKDGIMATTQWIGTDFVNENGEWVSSPTIVQS